MIVPDPFKNGAMSHFPFRRSFKLRLHYRTSLKALFSSCDPLNEDELLFHGDVLPDRFTDQFQVIAGSHEHSPSNGHLMQRQEFGFDDEIVEIGQPIGDEAVKFGAVQEPTLRDADLPDQFLIRHVAVFS